MQRQPTRLLLLVGLVIAVSPTSAFSQDLQASYRAVADIEHQAQQMLQTPLQRGRLRSPTHVEERLTDGELFYRLKDYVRASIFFTDIVDNYPNHAAFADALFLLSDSLFRAGDYLGARTNFRRVLERANEASFQQHTQRTLGRLIEIAIHTRDFDGVEGYFARLSQLPPSQVEAATSYFRAKYLYNKAGAADERGAPDGAADQAVLEQARVAFQGIAESSPYYGQARYFVGVIHTLRGQYVEAADAFRTVLGVRATSSEQRAVADLAQLAIGRLLYEAEQLEQSVAAYLLVPRTSANYDTALYELAWAYIRQGDAVRAERALEILAVAAPESRHIPDGKILRGNLLLRNGRLSGADAVFKEIGKQFTPVREELDELIARHSDAEAYFRQLVRDNMESFDANAFLPALARRWSVVEGDMDRAVEVLGDLAQARRLVKETSALVARLSSALTGTSRANLFPDLRVGRERVSSLRTRLSVVRRALMPTGPSAGAAPQLADVTNRRRALEAQLRKLPTSADDLEARNQASLAEYTALSRSLSELEVQILGLNARIAATDRYIGDMHARGTAVEGADAILAELQAQRAATAAYREHVDAIKIAIETGKLQVGIGDANDTRDGELRSQYDRLVDEERTLLAAAGRSNPEADALFRRISSLDVVLTQQEARIDQAAVERVTAIREVLDEEVVKLDGYRDRLASLETETEQVIGGVTLENYRLVRERFYDLVLRADVGRIDVSWAMREEHRANVEALTRERVRESQVLDDEFREIMDETGAGGGATP